MKYFYSLFLLLSLVACDKGSAPVDPVDPLPELTVFDVKQERDSVNSVEFKFFVQVSKASDKVITVNYTTLNQGAAAAGSDFTATNGTLTIPAGATLSYVSVTVLGKNIYEADKDFFVQLSNPENATLVGTGKATGIIVSPESLKPIDPSGYSTPLTYPGYSLAWHDEFDGPNIDLNSWKYDLGASGWGNNELQNYTSSSINSFISNGNLVIEARKESNGTYTSARMLTAGKKEFALGRIDIRAKLPKGKGIWPALWMLGSSFANNGWPKCGEIDIMEVLGHQPSKLYGTAHWGVSGSNNFQSSGNFTFLNSGDFSEKFHVFSLIWTQNSIRWLLDDVQYHSITSATTGSNPYPFNDPFFLIFNVAVGGNWPGNPDNTTQFPQRMLVDYVRVFQ